MDSICVQICYMELLSEDSFEQRAKSDDTHTTERGDARRVKHVVQAHPSICSHYLEIVSQFVECVRRFVKVT